LARDPLFWGFETEDRIKGFREVVEVVSGTVAGTLIDGIVIPVVVLTFRCVVREEKATKVETASFEKAATAKIAYQIELCEFQAAEICIATTTIQ
jgi:hypothetical protein